MPIPCLQDEFFLNLYFTQFPNLACFACAFQVLVQQAETVQEDTNKVDQTMKLRTNLGMATMQEAIGNSASSSDVNVKIENPSWVQLNSQVQIAGALKARLEKQVFERSACHKDLEASGKPEFKEFLKNVAEALGKAETALASLRTNLAPGKDTPVSSDKAECSSLKKVLEVDTNNGSMHLDGLKALCKRLIYDLSAVGL